MERKRPADKLKEDYQRYVDNMLDWKRYTVKLYSGKELMKDTSFLAYNREHLMIEIGQSFHLENMGITRIDISEGV